MELGLVRKIDGAFYRKWQFRISGELGMDSGFHGGSGFLLQGMRAFKGIEAGGAFFKIAEDGAGVNQALVLQDGFLVGRGIKSCRPIAHVCLDFLVNESVLGCDFCSGAFCLAAADSIGFQDYHLFSGLREIIGSQDSG